MQVDTFHMAKWAVERCSCSILRIIFENNLITVDRQHALGYLLWQSVFYYKSRKQSYENNRDTIRLLIEYGADVNIKDFDGKTPLYYAILYKEIGIAILLTRSGADLDCIRGYADTIKLLKEYRDK